MSNHFHSNQVTKIRWHVLITLQMISNMHQLHVDLIRHKALIDTRNQKQKHVISR